MLGSGGREAVGGGEEDAEGADMLSLQHGRAVQSTHLMFSHTPSGTIGYDRSHRHDGPSGTVGYNWSIRG